MSVSVHGTTRLGGMARRRPLKGRGAGRMRVMPVMVPPGRALGSVQCLEPGGVVVARLRGVWCAGRDAPDLVGTAHRDPTTWWRRCIGLLPGWAEKASCQSRGAFCWEPERSGRAALPTCQLLPVLDSTRVQDPGAGGPGVARRLSGPMAAAQVLLQVPPQRVQVVCR